MFPVTVGLNHRTAPLEVRERMSFHPSQIQQALKEMGTFPGLQGIVLLNTCNRLEIYAATTDVEVGLNSIKRFLAAHGEIDEQELQQYLYTHTLYDAVRHLYHVVSGLDSMVLGETQILGQVAHAYELAFNNDATNKVINVFFQNALTVGKRVRTETLIDQHPTSISYTAVELARREKGDLQGQTILILGAGEMSCLTAKYLVASGASTILVSNRSYEKALSLAQQISGKAINFNEIDQYLKDVDVVISATASKNYVIPVEKIKYNMVLRDYRPLLFIDIAVPRDIDPKVGQLKGVTLFDIDDLKGVIDEHHKAREQAAAQADKIIEEEMARFLKWHNSLFVIPTIVALQDKAYEIKDAQLSQTLNRLGSLTPKQEKIISSMANSIINQFLHIPITNLRKYADTRQGHLYTEILQNLFDLEVEDEGNRSTWSGSHQKAHGRAE